MSEAATTAESPSATTIDAQIKDNEHTDEPSKADLAAAQQVITSAKKYDNSDIEDVVVKRFGTNVSVVLKGRVVVSLRRVKKYLPDEYEARDILSHSSGAATVQISRID